MPRVEFEADTEDELVSLAWRWVMGPQRPSGPVAPDPADRWRLAGDLAKEGVDARNIGRLTARLARANAALEAVADRAEQALDGQRLEAPPAEDQAISAGNDAGG